MVDNGDRSFVGLLNSLVGSLILAVITAVVFYFGLLPGLSTLYPYIIGLALLVIIFIVVLAVAAGFHRHSYIAVCLRRTSYVAGAAVANFVIILIAMAISLTAGNLFSALLVFIGAFAYWFLVFSWGMLLRYLARAAYGTCISNDRDCWDDEQKN